MRRLKRCLRRKRFKRDASKVTSMLQVLGSLLEEIQDNHREQVLRPPVPPPGQQNQVSVPAVSLLLSSVAGAPRPPWKPGPIRTEVFAASLASAKAKPTPGSKGHAMFDPLVTTCLV